MSQPIHCKVSIQELDIVTLADRLVVILEYGEETKVHFTRDMEGTFFAHILPKNLFAKRTSIITVSESKIFYTD